jgi:hypothetical protein
VTEPPGFSIRQDTAVSSPSPFALRPSPSAAWESAWAPYDDSTYDAALEALGPEDVVLDIGAGDLRFARRAAARARRVIAVEQRADLVGSDPLPTNLEVVIADALSWAFPQAITVGVLLMRHCAHYRDYAVRLRAAGATRLITNARWGMGVEVIDLQAPRLPFTSIGSSWYACDCGAVGFAPGPAEAITTESLEAVAHVASCPLCDALA